MEVRDVCRKYRLHEQIAEVLRKSGITELYPPQKDAIQKGALDGKNLVLAVPTAAGKTLVSELCMLKSALKERGKCLYIVPLRALASEKYEEFKEKYEPLGVRVGISIDAQEEIIIEEDDELKIIHIGQLDRYFINSKSNGSFEWVENPPLYVLGFDPQTFKIAKFRATKLIRHPAPEEMLELATTSGRHCVVTADHSIFSLNDGEVVSARAGSLKPGNYVVIASRIEFPTNKGEIINVAQALAKKSTKANYFVRQISHFLLPYKHAFIQKFGKRRVKDWFRNDSVPLQALIEYFGVEKLSELPKECKLASGTSPNSIPNYIQVSAELARFIGYYLAEGCHDKYRISICFGPNEWHLAQDVVKCIESIFGFRSGVEKRPRELMVRISGPTAVGVVRDVLECGCDAKTKNVPSYILSAPLQVVSECLKAYFSGDGYLRCRKKGVLIAANSMSKRLMNQISFLLLRFGIVTNLLHRKRGFRKGSTEVYIYGGEQLTQFIKEIGFVERWKNKKIEATLAQTKMRKAHFSERIPTRHTSLLKLLRESKIAGEYRGVYSKKATVAKNTIREALQKMRPSRDKSNLLKLINGHMAFDEIKEVRVVKPNSQYVYDIEVKPNGERVENFIGGFGQIFLHNSTGDFDIADHRLARYDILVATSEKVDSLLRHRAKWLADVISVAVLDEVHLIDDPGRGPTLEILTARLRQVNPKLQVLALSATIKNADEIAEWLGAELVKSEWRPVPLKKGVYLDGKIKFDDGSKRAVKVEVEEALGALAIDTVREGGQALVFVSTRRAAQAAATLVTKYVKNALLAGEREQLVAVARTVEGALGEPTRTCRQLADCVRQGAAFHHAGLHHAQRKAVEDAFRKNLIKVICATPTLAAGVNLPSRRTIIRDYRRYVEPFGMQFIPVLEFHQMAGRAGRPQYDKYGEAVLIAHGKGEVEALFEEFIRAEPERITSKLATEPALRTHVLASIAAGYVNDVDGLLEFMGHTFFAHQYGTSDVERVVQRILDFLEREEMIRRQGKLLIATPFGERVSRLYIDPLSAVVLRDGMKGIAAKEPTALGLLHLICHTPDMGLLYLRERDYSDLEALYLDHADELLTPIPDERREPEKFEYLLAELKTAQMVQAWIDEVREEDIHERFGVGAGDIRRSADTAEWLLYAAHELASLFKVRPALAPLRKLHERVRHGVREELLELVQLRGIGRVRGRSLFRAGYRKLADIERATGEELARVPYIGPEIARSIKRQVERGAEPEVASAA